MSGIPSTITAGTTLRIPVTLTAYPAPAWQLSLNMRGPQAIDLVAAANGRQHMFSLDAATTAGWTPGVYLAAARASDGETVVEVERARIRVAPDVAGAGAGEASTHVQRVLAAIEAVIEGRAARDQERYRINNRELYRTPVAELLKLRDQYRREYARAQQAARGSELLGRRVTVRF